MRRAGEPHTPFHPREIMLGDKAYKKKKASKNVLTVWVQSAANSNRPPLTREQLQFNNMLNGSTKGVVGTRCMATGDTFPLLLLLEVRVTPWMMTP